MRVVVQRVRQARVTVEGRTVGEINHGLLVLLGVGKQDSAADADYLIDKVVGLRVFPDEEGKMNRSVVDAGGSLLVISQFTLYGDVRRGKRPSFDGAAGPAEARILYQYFVQGARDRGIPVATGEFQATMEVSLTNYGPVTILCDTVDRSTAVSTS